MDEPPGTTPAPADRVRAARARPPVMLATIASAPLHPSAVDLAVEVAAEAAALLVLVDVADAPAGGRGAAPPPPPLLVLVDVVDAPAGVRGAAPPLPASLGPGSLPAAAERAAAAGVAGTMIGGPGVRPVATLVAVVAEQRPRLLVFAPDPGRLSPWRG